MTNRRWIEVVGLAVCAVALTALGLQAGSWTIDGDFDDWIGAAVVADPIGDSGGGSDLGEIAVCCTEDSFYAMVEIHTTVQGSFQLLLYFNKPPTHQLRISISEPPQMTLSAIDGERFRALIHGGEVASGPDGIELRVPLDALDSACPVQVGVRLLNLEDAAADASIDESGVIPVPSPEPHDTHSDDPPASSATEPTAPSFLDLDLPPLSAGPLPDGVSVAGGWTAETFIPSNGLTAPCRLALSSFGELLVNEVRGDTITRIGRDGSLSSHADCANLIVFYYAIDAADNIYVQSQTSDSTGSLYRFGPAGNRVTMVLNSPLLYSGQAMMLAASPQGDVYLQSFGTGTDPTTGAPTTRWMKVDPSGTLTVLDEAIADPYQALQFAPDGTLYGTVSRRIFRVDLDHGTRLETVFDPQISCPELDMGFLASCGLDIGDDGSFYLNDADTAYRIAPDGTAAVLGTDFVSLQGIVVDDAGAVYVASRFDNGIYRIADGRIDVIVPPNNLTTPQAMAFAPNGDLYVCEDEAVVVGRYRTDGSLVNTYEAIVTQPPVADIVVDAAGVAYVTEAEPAWPSQLVALPPDGTEKIVVSDALKEPSGIALIDDVIYVAEFGGNRISIVDRDGTVIPLVEDLHCPHAMTSTPSGELLVLMKEPESAGEGHWICRVDLDGRVEHIAPGRGLFCLHVMQDGTMLAGTSGTRPGQGQLLEIRPDGGREIILSGLYSVSGIAEDVMGRIYISDDFMNVILRLQRDDL